VNGNVGISGSEMATWKRCPRLWLIRYYYCMVPAEPAVTGNMQLGTRVHTALEALYGYDLDPLVVLQVTYGAEIEAHPEHEAELRKEWDLANAMVQGYMEWSVSEGKDADYRVTATEQEIRVPLPGVDGVDLRGQLDQIMLEVSTGFLKFRDWKTADGFDMHHLLELNPQFRLYSVLMHLRGGTRPGTDPQVPMGGLVTTLRRCKRTERAKPPFFQTDPVNYNPEQLDATLIGAQQTCREIMAARAALDWAGPQSMEVFNRMQRGIARPVPVITDCKWRCELSRGLCVAMDDGSDWVGMLFRSGRWVQGDPYAHYDQRGMAALRGQIAHLTAQPDVS
jgi:hypothetical protein